MRARPPGGIPMRARASALLAVAGLLLAAVLPIAVTPAAAQLGGVSVPRPDQLVFPRVTPVALKAGGTAVATIELQILDGWHINANPPSPDYMIPTSIELRLPSGIRAGKIDYPAGHEIKLEFDETPLSVYDGKVAVSIPITAADDAVNGRRKLSGKVRFQACNDQVCLAPAELPFVLDVTLTGGRDSGSESAPGADTTASTSGEGPDVTAEAILPTPAQLGGMSTGPPPGGAAVALDNPIARAFEKGSFVAFLTIFFIGLALNLTPCVYPMLGVTVSIFGARRAAPPLQVLGLAILYVLGIAAMYSTLGLVAAFTGGLFGAFLQNAWVLVGIGVLLALLSLSMFGLYEFQMPAELLSRIGGSGTTSAAGVFLSGLLVGIFAAPCIGPPVVALLAVVGAKGDPWFGFLSFFVLSLGLGLPYLILATFSNLLQQLPSSGDWMVWVKKVFGVILLGVGVFYVLLGLAPKWSMWVLPVTLVVGGLYLGFVEKSGFRHVKRLAGAAAVLVGLLIVVTTPRQGIAFESFTAESLQEALAAGKPVMLEFSADWCLPCHELERNTFTDRRVIQESRRFHVFKVDLTRYDSPEAEEWRKRYQIPGVPTVVFLAADGSEVREARVHGFMPPDQFLERMSAAAAAVGRRAGTR